jgi:uncharacterized protein YbbC (DUF1343 family)
MRRRRALALLCAFSAACSVAIQRSALAQTQVLPGVDVLLRDGNERLNGKRLGLITNATGRSRSGVSTIDALMSDARWPLVALFSPEHGIRGEAAAGAAVDSSTDAQTGLPIYSLYGNTTRPTAAMLQGLDALVYDIQDVGARTYTYTSTLLEVMHAAADTGLPIVVLDRPNPIGGDQLDGNVLDSRFASFVGPAPIAMRYGMTIGELAQWFSTELGVAADLRVVRMDGWQRGMWFDDTGLEWVNPSPNIRSLTAAALYPGTVLFEGTSLSEGRGTPTPFEWIGAPWLDAGAWADALNAAGLVGVQFTPRDEVPDASAAKYPGEVCHGVAIRVVDRAQLRPMAMAVHMLASLPGTPRFIDSFDRLAGTDQVRNALQGGQAADDIVASWQPDLEGFKTSRQRVLLY